MHAGNTNCLILYMYPMNFPVQVRLESIIYILPLFKKLVSTHEYANNGYFAAV